MPEGAGLLATGLMIGQRMELWYAPAGQSLRKPDGVHDRQPVADPAPGLKPQPTSAPAGGGR